MRNKEFYSEKNVVLLSEYFLELKEILDSCKEEVMRMYRIFKHTTCISRFYFFGRGITVQKFISLLGYFYVDRPEFWNYNISRIKNERDFLQKAEIIKSGIRTMEKFIEKKLWKELPIKHTLIYKWLNSVEYKSFD